MSEKAKPTTRKYIKLVTVEPIMWFRRPLAEQGERRGEHSFIHDDHLKAAVVTETPVGIQIETKAYHTVLIPWSYVRALWFEDGK